MANRLSKSVTIEHFDWNIVKHTNVHLGLRSRYSFDEEASGGKKPCMRFQVVFSCNIPTRQLFLLAILATCFLRPMIQQLRVPFPMPTL